MHARRQQERSARIVARVFAILAALLPVAAACADGGTLRIGSKRFTESYVLAEIAKAAAEPAVHAEHRQGLGNTAIVFEALRRGDIDLYPEYTGTIEREILHHAQPVPPAQLRAELAALGLGIGPALGFNDGYGLAMREGDAQRFGIRRIGDLARHPDLRPGLSHEFLGRADGWPGLAARYRLPQQPSGLDHGIAYDALAQGRIDLIDIYTTDARIASMGLRVLDDDLKHFPRYDAVLLYRLDAARRFPEAWRRIGALAGRIDEAAMIRMNAQAELEGRDFATIAREFLGRQAVAPAPRTFRDKLFGPDFWRLAGQHLFLVAASVVLACLAGVPLGVAAARRPRIGRIVLSAVGLLQTIPSLALLAILIPLAGGIGTRPAVIALLLYALLPIVANTCTGLLQVPDGLRQAARALGLTARDRLRHVELPLALPTILAGVRTATVINVGTATIAAFIGAGGFGERIATGLALNDDGLLLAGALPAAALALLAQWGFDAIERTLWRPSTPGERARSGGPD